MEPCVRGDAFIMCFEGNIKSFIILGFRWRYVWNGERNEVIVWISVISREGVEWLLVADEQSLCF